MVKGMLNVNEPMIRDWVQLEDIAIIIVPGLAFDLQCGRLGHGGGYYDRILSHRSCGTITGTAFEFQIRDEVPMTSMDVRMDVIVTEKRIITAGTIIG